MEAIITLNIIYTFFKQIRKKKGQSILYCRNFSSGGQNCGINTGSG